MKHLLGLFVVIFSLFAMPSLGAEVQEYQIPSSIDAVKQRVLLYAPETEAPVPLLVSLHTWSAHCDRYDAYERALAECQRLGWIFLSPEFRGPNNRPEACASDRAVQDVLDAVGVACKTLKVDTDRIYVLGGSGGGHMALTLAHHAPWLWAAVSAWVPISDLAAWHAFSKVKGVKYAKDVEGCVAGDPNTSAVCAVEARRRSPLYHLHWAAGLPISIEAGIQDGHKGSVPVSHSLRAFNVLAKANGVADVCFSKSETNTITQDAVIPDEVAGTRSGEEGRMYPVLLRRQAGPAQVTIFDGMHNIDPVAGMRWLSTQRRVERRGVENPVQYAVQLEKPLVYDGGDYLWFHPRAAVADTTSQEVVMTLQRYLNSSDYYSGLYAMYSHNGGAQWSAPVQVPELNWRDEGRGIVSAVCDVTPGYHEKSGKLLAFGAKVRYREGRQLRGRPKSREVAYTVYAPESGQWTPWRMLALPDTEPWFWSVVSGCSQWCVTENGDILLPVYCNQRKGEQYASTVLRCRLEGNELNYVSHGDMLFLPLKRGIYEPSLIRCEDTYYLTLRNDERGYVTRSMDGQHFAPLRPWCFDDGSDLGSYNTQQHWLTYNDALFLVYTRRGADNDHIMRNRAPLFMAQVDPVRMQVLRETEQVLIPERGASLGNFGACRVSDAEAWVTASELVNDAARQRGAEGATFISRIQWEGE